MSAEEPAGLLLQRGGQTSVMSNVDLGQLHAELKKLGVDKSVTEKDFSKALKALLAGADTPSDDVIKALYRAFDTDGSGQVDEAELIAGCTQLCSGDPTTKLRLAFACFDKDGDGHLDPQELSALLRGTIAPAVSALHSAVDFASFSADESGANLDEINNEAGGAASLSKAGEEGKVRIELKTPVGAVTIFVPSAALSGDAIGGQGSAISLDQFLKALVDGAMSKYDTDKNGTLELDEFVSFAAANPFLTAWFGRLASKRSKGSGQSWKDVDP